MKLIVSRKLLADALALAGRALSLRGEGIASCAKIESTLTGVFVSCVGAEMSIRCRVDGAEITSRGEALLSARAVGAIRNAASETAEIGATDGKVHIACGGDVYDFAARDVREYPAFGQIDCQPIRVRASDLVRAVRICATFVDETATARFALGGCLFSFSGGRLVVVATDTRKLARVDVGSVTVAEDVSLVVPRSACIALASAFADVDGDVDITCGKNGIQISTDQCMIVSRLVEGRFPPWEKVIPKSAPRDITAECGALRSAFQRARIFETDEARAAVVRVSPGDVSIVATGAGEGEAKISAPVDYVGEEIVVHIDPKQVADALRGISTGDVLHIGFADPPRGPMTIMTDDGRIEILVMTMETQS